ncbi:MAG: ComF family protein [Lachnospiraceae bacterium]|nr:ComF family protein [Lachnospiraceae bacterium]
MRQGFLSSMGRITLDLLYPRLCPVCQEPAPAGRLICPSCLSELPYIEYRRCQKCGKPVEDGEVFCRDCTEMTHLYREGMGVFFYDDRMRETIAALKYRHRREFGRPLGALMYSLSRDRLLRWKPDLVIPVPVHSARRAERGYNHAAELAFPVAEFSGIPVSEAVLIRTEKTKAMKKLSAAERRENLKGAFAVAASAEVPHRILLIDDIYTTGATVDACAGVLLAKGAEEVYFLSLAIGGGFLSQF